MYSIVVFKTNEVAVVPDSWLTADGKCLWPSKMENQTLDSRVMKNLKPGKDWKRFEVRILKQFSKIIQLLVVY